MTKPREVAEDVDELDVAQSRSGEVWSALQELTRRMMSSPKAYRELAARREDLEADLQVALADIGAIVFEKLHEPPADSVDPEPLEATSQQKQGPRAAESSTADAKPELRRQQSDLDVSKGTSKTGARIVGHVEHTPAPSGAHPERTELITAADVASAREQMGPQFEDEGPDEKLIATAEHLPDIKSRLGSPPETIEGFPEFMGELGTLARATEDEQIAVWAKLPDEVQRCLAGYVAARLRHLQEEVPSNVSGSAGSDSRMSEIFTRLNQHLRTERPGFVHGMKFDHAPKGASWKADAENWRQELADLARHYYGDGVEGAGPTEQFNPERALYEIEAMLDGEWRRAELISKVENAIERGLDTADPRFVRLLRPYRDLFITSNNEKLYAVLSEKPATEDAVDEDERDVVLPDDWSWGAYLSDARTVMVGGDLRADARDRIIETFDLSVFDWVPTTDNKGVRQVQALCKRIQRGSVDVVFLLTKYISHKLSNAVTDAVKDSDAHLVFLNDGYGVQHMKKAIEEQMSQVRASAVP